MLIKTLPLDQIKPYENNPHVNDEAVDAVVTSLREFGFSQPIVIDNDGVIVVGHTGWKAANKLGFEKVPVHLAMDLTPEKARVTAWLDVGCPSHRPDGWEGGKDVS